MKLNEIHNKGSISYWKVSPRQCYIKVPYAERTVMKDKKPFGEYCKGGKIEFLQYSIECADIDMLLD